MSCDISMYFSVHISWAHMHTYTHTPVLESACMLTHVRSFETLWTVVQQDPSPWDSPSNNTGLGWHVLLQVIFLTQGLNSCLLPCRQIFYHWATRESLVSEDATYKKIFSFFNQFSSVSQSRLYFCAPIDFSTPGFLVHHQLPENASTHVYQVGDAIQSSHPLSSPSSPPFNLSQLQGLSKSVNSLHQVAKVLELQLQHQSFQ